MRELRGALNSVEVAWQEARIQGRLEDHCDSDDLCNSIRSRQQASGIHRMKVQRRSRRILTMLEHASIKFDKMVEIARLSNAVNQTDPKLLEELSAGVLLQLEAAFFFVLIWD